MTATCPRPWLRTFMEGVAIVGSSLLVLATSAHPASAQEVDGTWIVAVDLGPGGGGEVTLSLEQDADTIYGIYTGSYGTALPLSGTVAGNRIALSFTTVEMGEITYDGQMAPDTMWGSVTYGTRYDGTFEAYKQPPEPLVATVLGYAVLALLIGFALKVIFFPKRA